MGDFDVELYTSQAPITVSNFLTYVEDGDYSDSIVHRSIPNFVIQGGGFSVSNPSISNSIVTPIPTDPPIQNEFGASNVRGTIAMAKLGGDPDSATNQWFVNLSDNSTILDSQNGGFTVFGEVTGTGMETVDAIAGLAVVNLDGGILGETPIMPSSLGDQYVVVNNIRLVPEPGSNLLLAFGLVGFLRMRRCAR